MRTLLVALAMLACGSAHAQFDIGRIISKGLEVGEEAFGRQQGFRSGKVDLGNGITAQFLGATSLHPDQNLQRYVNRVGKWVAMHSGAPTCLGISASSALRPSTRSQCPADRCWSRTAQ
jgi:predicted Zn-dependent protease